MSDIFTEHLFQKVLLSKKKIRNLLGSWFVPILQKLFAVIYNLKNFMQISIIARIFAQESNFQQCNWYLVLSLSVYTVLYLEFTGLESSH